uniref:Uncharacterized protein n=1 Tax=Fagus sylvatica TaxID=28930 RepID=A0A2N9HSI3_FAGSY
MAPGSRGVGAVFVHSSGEDSGQTGDAIGEPRVPRRSRSHYLSNAPGLADQLVASRKDSAREGGSCAAYFCKVPDSRESELGLVRYGPASRVHRGVFGPFEGSFPIRIPADPDKFLAIREFHVVHGDVSSFQCARARRSTCCESGRLCAQAWQRRWENSGNFSTALFRRPVFTRVVDVAPDVGFRRSWYRRKACATYFSTVQALHRGELGFARYDLANRGRRNVPYAKGFGHNSLSFLVRFRPVKYGIEALDILSIPWSRGGQFDPVFGLVNGPVKPWSNLVNLGQTWSKLSKLLGNVSRNFISRVSGQGQTLGNVSGPSSWEYLMRRALVGSDRLGSGSVSFCVPTPEKIPGFLVNLILVEERVEDAVKTKRMVDMPALMALVEQIAKRTLVEKNEEGV